MALKARAHESNLRSGGADKRDERLVLHAVDLSPLVEPFRGNGKLSLRFEGLPPRARFSNGNRAGERAWSLTPEDLPGLSYVLAPDTDIDHTVTLRVVGLERGDTLGVQTVRMKDTLGTSATTASSPPSSRGNDELRAHLDESKKSLSSLESQLADALKVIQTLSTPTNRDSGADLEAARAQWKVDEAERLASFQAQWREAESARINDLNLQWQNKLQDLATRHVEEIAAARAQNNSGELKTLREKVASLQAMVEERESSLGSTMKCLEASREEHSHELTAARSREAKLKQALQDLEDQHARALKAAEEQLRQQALANGNENEAIRQLNDTVRHLKSTLEERDRVIAEFTRKDEAQRANHARLREEAAAAIAALEEAKHRHDSELSRLRDQAAKDPGGASPALAQLTENVRHLQTTLAERERTLTEMSRTLEQKEAAQAALRTEAEQAASSLASLKKAHAQELARVEDALQAARKQPTGTTEGADGLKDAVKALQMTLAEREQALTRLSRELEQERRNREAMELESRHLHERLETAEHTFARDHAKGLSEAEANWQKQFAVELEQMKARAEAAESASSDVRKRMQDMARLENEVSALRTSLAEREAALQAEQERIAKQSETLAAREQEVSSQLRGNRPGRTMLREALIGVACTVATIIIVPALGFWNPPPQVLKVEVPASTSGITAPFPAHQIATISRTTRLRAGPDKSERALLRAESGVEVTVLENRGDWLRVRMNYKTRVAEGWIETSSVDLGQPHH